MSNANLVFVPKVERDFSKRWAAGQWDQSFDNCVTVTEEKVKTIDKEIKVNTEDTKQLKEAVADHEGRLVELKETVDETVDKVDELNHKVYIDHGHKKLLLELDKLWLVTINLCILFHGLIWHVYV